MQKTIYFNGTIITVDDKSTIAEAVLVENGKIAKVGTNDDVLSMKDEDIKLVDLEGKTMVPGFIDPHGHIVAISQTLLLVQLAEVTSREEMIEKLINFKNNTTLPEGSWLIGFGYDNSTFWNFIISSSISK